MRPARQAHHPLPLQLVSQRRRAELEFISQLLSQQDPAYSSWLAQAHLYDTQEKVHPAFFQMVAHLAHWRALYDRKPFYAFTKRCFDLAVASLLAALVFPLLAVFAALIQATSPGPIFFRQLRVGHLGKPFWILKLRTMYEGSEKLYSFNEPLKKIKNDPRSTPVGRFLRNYKLDELPQLFNVIRGEMSLVGPRPLPLDETITAPEKYFSRLGARPGMTGLWQAHFPNTIPGWRKIALDAKYVKRASWSLDLKILAKTIQVVLRGENRHD